jgi:hypothetical protein
MGCSGWTDILFGRYNRDHEEHRGQRGGSHHPVSHGTALFFLAERAGMKARMGLTRSIIDRRSALNHNPLFGMVQKSQVLRGGAAISCAARLQLRQGLRGRLGAAVS